MSAFPHLPLFTDAFIADTVHLNAQETGAYLMLMMVAWRSPGCRIADDDDKLCRFARMDRRTWLRIKPSVMGFWTLTDGFWSQKRLSKEREYVSKRAEVNRENGKQGGRPKSLPNNNMENPAGSSRVSETKAPIPTPIPIKEDNPQDPKGSLAPKGAEKRGHRLPEEFIHSEQAIQTCAEWGYVGADAENVLGEFWDHWSNIGGAKGVMLDWNKTLRNRLRQLGRRKPGQVIRGAFPQRRNPNDDRADLLEALKTGGQHVSSRSHQLDLDHGSLIEHQGGGGPDWDVLRPSGGGSGRFPEESLRRLASPERR